MKLTKSKLKEIIREELLNEYMDLGDPIKKAKALFDGAKHDLDYLAGGSTDSDSIEYEGPGGHYTYKNRHKALTKWQQNVDKTLKKIMKDYEKVWKVK
tara:strand:- start:337 stop:630 length:294 start_codon:yes stop_codon:yes gene_type:complete